MNTNSDVPADSSNTVTTDGSASEPPGRPTQTGILKLLVKRTQALVVDGMAVAVLSEICAALLCAIYFPEVVKHNQTFATVLALAFFAGYLGCCTGLLPIIGAVVFVLSFSIPSLFALSEIPLMLSAALLMTAMFVDALYHIVWECTAQATIGKQFSKIQLLTKKGQPVSLRQAALRHSLKGFGLLALLFVPVTWVAFCNRRQMLHDVVAGTVVDTSSAIAILKNNPLQWSQDFSELPKLKGAGIPRRVVASIIDGVLYYIADAVSFCGFAYVLARYTPENFGFVPSPYEDAAAFALYCLLIVPAFCLPAILMAAFESSKLQATPGKIIAGLKVVNLDGGRCGFWQALVKQFIQACIYASLVTLAIITLYVLKDKVSVAGLAIAFTFYLCYGAIFCFTFDNQQTLFDRLTRRFVLNDLPNSVLEITESGAR